MRWFRFYDEVLDNIKVQSLPPELFKFWVNILCVTSRCDKPVTLQETLHVTNNNVSSSLRGDGYLPDLSEISFYLRMSKSEIKKNLDELIKANLIDGGAKLKVHNWGKRQYKSDNSNERVKKHREKKRAEKDECNVTRNVTCNSSETVNVTHQIQSTDTDTDIYKKPKSKDLVKKRKTSFPENFCVTDHHRELAQKNGWPNPDDEFEAFRDRCLRDDAKYADWDRAFYTWLRTAKKFNSSSKNNYQTTNPDDLFKAGR